MVLMILAANIYQPLMCSRLCAKGLRAGPCRIQTQTVWLQSQARLQHSNGRAQDRQPRFESCLHLSHVQLVDLRHGVYTLCTSVPSTIKSGESQDCQLAWFKSIHVCKALRRAWAGCALVQCSLPAATSGAGAWGPCGRTQAWLPSARMQEVVFSIRGQVQCG